VPIRLLGRGTLAALGALPRIVDRDGHLGIELGVMLHGVEADFVTVRIVQLGQDPADGGPVHAQQAAAVEPLIAEFWQQGREQTRRAHAVVLSRAASDGLLDPRVDLDWLIEISTIVGGAETYLLITRLTGWDLDTYQDWLATTYARLALIS
jgi:hypothetical protein